MWNISGALQPRVRRQGRDRLEHRRLIGFHEALGNDERLRLAYEADKQRILAAGLNDTLDYCDAKTDFITSTLVVIARS